MAAGGRMMTGEILLSSAGPRMPRAATVSTSRTGRGAETGWRHSSRTERDEDRRGALFPALLALAALVLLGLLVFGPSLSWPVTLGLGMLSVLTIGLAWALSGPVMRGGRR